MQDRINILFIGDIVGKPGRKAIEKFLPELKSKFKINLTIANCENAAGGLGVTEKVALELLEHVDVLTSGNHIWQKKEIIPFLDKNDRIIRPANFPPGNPGKGYTVFHDKRGNKVAIINLQGRIFMDPIDCPFQVADRELSKIRKITPIIIVDFHAEATSEKQALGWYLDGRVSALIGTHTHVPTADERILPGGTAYITDIGMVGGFDSVIGIKKENALRRLITAIPSKFEVDKGRRIFSGVHIEIDTENGKAINIKRVIEIEKESG